MTFAGECCERVVKHTDCPHNVTDDKCVPTRPDCKKCILPDEVDINGCGLMAQCCRAFEDGTTNCPTGGICPGSPGTCCEKTCDEDGCCKGYDNRLVGYTPCGCVGIYEDVCLDDYTEPAPANCEPDLCKCSDDPVTQCVSCKKSNWIEVLTCKENNGTYMCGVKECCAADADCVNSCSTNTDCNSCDNETYAEAHKEECCRTCECYDYAQEHKDECYEKIQYNECTEAGLCTPTWDYCEPKCPECEPECPENECENAGSGCSCANETYAEENQKECCADETYADAHQEECCADETYAEAHKEECCAVWDIAKGLKACCNNGYIRNYQMDKYVFMPELCGCPQGGEFNKETGTCCRDTNAWAGTAPSHNESYYNDENYEKCGCPVERGSKGSWQNGVCCLNGYSLGSDGYYLYGTENFEKCGCPMSVDEEQGDLKKGVCCIEARSWSGSAFGGVYGEDVSTCGCPDKYTEAESGGSCCKDGFWYYSIENEEKFIVAAECGCPGEGWPDLWAGDTCCDTGAHELYEDGTQGSYSKQLCGCPKDWYESKSDPSLCCSNLHPEKYKDYNGDIQDDTDGFCTCQGDLVSYFSEKEKKESLCCCGENDTYVCGGDCSETACCSSKESCAIKYECDKNHNLVETELASCGGEDVYGPGVMKDSEGNLYCCSSETDSEECCESFGGKLNADKTVCCKSTGIDVFGHENKYCGCDKGRVAYRSMKNGDGYTYSCCNEEMVVEETSSDGTDTCCHSKNTSEECCKKINPQMQYYASGLCCNSPLESASCCTARGGWYSGTIGSDDAVCCSNLNVGYDIDGNLELGKCGCQDEQSVLFCSHTNNKGECTQYQCCATSYAEAQGKYNYGVCCAAGQEPYCVIENELGECRIYGCRVIEP